MLDELKQKVYNANMELVKQGLVIYTWGNVSEITEDRKYIVIKPSGVPYENLNPDDMVIVEVESGKVVESRLKPSSDTDTHLEVYKAFEGVRGITHTHSVNATSFAQAGVSIKALGTTHADYFYGDIPCTRELTKVEIESAYELNTGKVIVNLFKESKINPMDVPGVLVKNHGPFAFGKSAENSVYNAKVMETVAEMNIKTLFLNKDTYMNQYILDKHYFRKHGENATYGQMTIPCAKMGVKC